MLAGDRHDRIHVRRLAGEVNRDYGRVRGVMAASSLRIEIERAQLNIGEHGDHVGFDDRRGRGKERVGWNDDFALGLEACRDQAQAQRHRAIDDRDAMLTAMHGGEPLFELGDFMAIEPAPATAAECAARTARFLMLAKDGPRCEGTLPDGAATQEGEML